MPVNGNKIQPAHVHSKDEDRNVMAQRSEEHGKMIRLIFNVSASVYHAAYSRG